MGMPSKADQRPTARWSSDLNSVFNLRGAWMVPKTDSNPLQPGMMPINRCCDSFCSASSNPKTFLLFADIPRALFQRGSGIYSPFATGKGQDREFPANSPQGFCKFHRLNLAYWPQAGIAQLVEQATENRRVPSSNLGPGISNFLITRFTPQLSSGMRSHPSPSSGKTTARGSCRFLQR
jgi:hypothetical protein